MIGVILHKLLTILCRIFASSS
uniref:Uncharacterized protein n=1 Tax=Anguilla anguilla TaxID=7936 RepID=A0A0E9TPU4_ANGAN